VSINDGASHYVCILIHTISVGIQPTMEMNIHNQCSDFRLKCRSSFRNGVDFDEGPDLEVDTGSMNSINLMPGWAEFEGAFMYELERKHAKPSNQLESTDILLLIAWKSEGYKKFRMFVHLIECNKWPFWGPAELEEYYLRYASQLLIYTGPIKDTWLIPGGAVLMTGLELDFTKRDGVLNITISDGVKDDHTKRLELINLNR
jgi:hypothetical protein